MGENNIQDAKFITFMKFPSTCGGKNVYDNIRFKNRYLEKYNSYIQENKVIPFKIYSDKGHEEYYYHFQITSEKNKDVIYDIVLKFFGEGKCKSEDSLDNYDFQIFSNSPGFVFQFAYVYNKYNLLIPEFKDHFVEGSLDIEPTKSNPLQSIGYDYTIYFALYHLAINHFYVTKKEIARIARPLREFHFADVLSTQLVLDKRNPQTLLTFKRIKREIARTVFDKPKETLKDILTKVGLTKPSKAKKGKSAVKAKKGSKARKR